jgi:hypothetical protein
MNRKTKLPANSLPAESETHIDVQVTNEESDTEPLKKETAVNDTSAMVRVSSQKTEKKIAQTRKDLLT